MLATTFPAPRLNVGPISATSSGVAVTGTDQADVPPAFDARTLMVYSTSLVSPVIEYALTPAPSVWVSPTPPAVHSTV